MNDSFDAAAAEWLKSKGQGAAPEGDKTFDAAAAEWMGARQRRARTVFERALAVNPDQAAQSKKLMNTTGLPLSVIERNLDEVKRKEQARMLDLARMAQESPVLARQLVDPTFTNQAHDDIENLANVNRTMLGTAGDVGVTALKGAVGLPQALVGVADLVTGGYAGKGVEAIGVRFKDTQAILDNLYSPAQQAANKEVAEVDGFINTLGAMLQNPSTIATMVGESLPQMLGGAAIGRGLVAAFSGKFAPLIAAAMGEGTIAAGAAAEQFRADNADGLIGVRETLASLGTGVGTSLFGILGGRIASKLGLEDIDTALVAKGLDGATAKAAKAGFVSSIVKAGVSEGVFEELPQSIQEQMWQNWVANRPLGQGVGKAAAQGVLAGFAMGGGFQAVTRFGDQVAAVEDGQRQAERLQAMLQAATGSLLRERNPEEFRALVQAMAENTEGAPKEVFVDAEVLNQLSPEVLAQLPGVAEQMPEALAANSVVSIPVADVLTVAPGTPLEQLLIENARIGDPTAMSQAEAKVAGEKAQEFLAQEAQRVIQQASDQRAMQESSDRVRQGVLDQLNAVGRFRKEVNEGYATWTAAFYTTMAGRLGITPEEMAAQYPLRITGKTGTAESVGQPEGGKLGEMTVEAFNFGKSNRTTLSGRNFGNGLAGNNRDLYLNAADKRLSKRIYFYVDKGTGINPEAGVGGIARKFNLTNIYDGDTDPMRLKTGRDQLGFESAVLDAGFSGYLTRMSGTQSGQVILLGDQTVTGELLGPTTSTRGKVVPPEGIRPSKGRDIVVDAINANTALPAGEAPLWMWKNALSKQPEVLAALTAAGIFDASESTKYYKSELIKAYQDATPPESYAQASRVKTGPDLFRNVIDTMGLSDAEVKSTAIEFMTGLPGDMAFLPPVVGGIPDVVQFLHARRLESGLPVLDITKPEHRTQLARLMAAEGLAAITSAGNALAWYDQTIRETLSQMAVKYPELETNPHARNAFLIAMAITSQGMNVETNLGAAIELYDAYRLTVDANGVGKFPERGWGESASQMVGNLKLANELMVEMGPEMLRRFLSTPFTVGELTTAGFEVGGELADELVLGSSVFGPKIGFGFYSNLSGNFDPVTMDMWFMRTKGRLAGTLPALDPDRLKNQLARFRAGLKQRGPKGKGIYAAQLDKDAVKAAMTDDAAAVALARKINSMHQKDFKDNRALFDSGVRQKSEIVLASATIIQSMDKPTDAPASGGERRLLRDVVNQATAMVSEAYGKRVPSAAFQALIWYPEQELYSALGVKLAVTSQDYSGGARKILEKEGFSEQQLASARARAAAQPGSGSSRPVDGQSDAGTAGGDGQVVGGAGPLTADERAQFIAQRNARIIAEQRAAAARVNFEVAPDPNDLELVSRWRMLSQQARLAISDRVVQQILPKVLKALKAKGALLPQVGSYLDDTNPSFALRLDKGDPAQVAKTLGFILSQDSMMALAPVEFEGSFKSSALRVQVGEKSAEEIDQIYQTLRAIKVDGRQVIGGQSTSGGVMSILLDSADDGDAVATLVDQALAGAYNVKVHEVFAAFPEKPEYDYASPESDPAGDEGLARQRARDARAQATDLLRKELDNADAAAADPAGPGQQTDRPLEQGPRGTFAPANLELALNENADLSTFLHETGHFFLEVMADLASRPDAPVDVREDMGKLLKWFGVKDLETWNALPLDGKRPYHERFAESFEQYLMEGKAPSVELQPLFRKFRAWLLNVYQSIKAFIDSRVPVTAGGGELAQMPPPAGFETKVVDAQGNPLRMYHGTKEAIEGAFRPERGMIGTGVYFTSNPDEATEYATNATWNIRPNVVPAYVRISNPFYVSGKWDKVPKDAAAQGYDGVILRRADGSVEWAVPFDPKQIVSAISGEVLGQDPNATGGLNIQLSDEIRQVFDRMLASQEQIAQAEEVAGLLPEEDATAEALEKLTARSLRDLKWTVNARAKAIKELQKQAATLRKGVLAEVTAEVNQMPEFQAKDMLDKTRRENKQQLNDTELAIIADAFQYPSVDAMLKAIDAAGSKADVIQGMTDQRMLERHGDLIDQRAIEQAANEAVHNEARARSLATELKSQAEALNPRKDTGRANAAGSRITVNALVEAAKQFGANVAAKTPLRDLKAKAAQHLAAERRAGKRWTEATAAGKTEEAIKAKRDQMLNHAAARAAMDAQAEMRKMLEFFRRVVKDGNEKTVEKGRDPDVVNAARAILGAYGVAPKGAKSALEYLDLVEKNDPAMFAALQPSIQGALNMAQPLDALTMDELRGLHEEIQAMWHLAKRSRQMEVDGKLLDREDLADELYARMDEIGIPDQIPGEGKAVTKAEQRALFLRQGLSFLRRVEQWAEGMDGKYGGPFLRYIFQPIKAAADRYRADRTAYRKKLQALVDKIAPIVGDTVINAPELGYEFGTPGSTRGTAMNEILHAILHTGNESNKRKLLLGRKWATENPDGTLDTSRWDAFITRLVNEGKLQPAHFDFVQGVWDLMESTKPLAQKAHRDAYGRYFAEVTADSFIDPWGQTRRGGYAPAIVDPEQVKDNELRKLAEAENESMTYAFPAPNKGFTKGRVEYNRPLLLDLRSIGQHLDKVLLFSHMTVPASDVRRLISNKQVGYGLTHIDPSVVSGMLQPWLQRSAQQIVETPIPGAGKWARVPSIVRARAGMALMFANISNAIQQVTGLSTAMVKVKPSYMMRALAQHIAHPVKAARSVWDASTYMDDRAKNEVAVLNEQMQDILINPSVYERAQTWSMRHGYFLQTAIDNALSPIVWTGAYNQAMADGVTHDEAVSFADGTVRQTQGSTLPEDVSRFETGPAYARAFTQFIGYFNMVANTNATALKNIANEVGLKNKAGRAFSVVMLGLLVPIWAAEAIALAFRGGPDDEDDDGYLDDWLAQVFGFGTVKGLLAMIPIAGQAANSAVTRLDNNPMNDRISLSPGLSLLESALGGNVQTVAEILDSDKEVNARRAVRDAATLVSVFTGLPVYAAGRPLGYLAGMVDDKIDPTGPVDLARGLITGTPSPESK